MGCSGRSGCAPGFRVICVKEDPVLAIYNTLTGRKEEFRPLVPGKVRMYVCGITVYDYCHLGHARMIVVFDIVVRYLRARGYEVTYVRNITDVDDKIIKRAREQNEAIDAVTTRFIAFMNEDAAALGVIKPDVEPRATQHIDEMLRMIERLLARGHAYQAANGGIYYDVSSFKSYGRLSGKRVEDLRAGARVEVDEAKDDPLDFVLWKRAKDGEPSWGSPWGPGRPGWHIECSAMSTECLGAHFDIHGGGQDLQFPHHENEIAQSVGATGQPFVNVWMHNGFVRVDEEKMSKSLGNFFTVREVLQRYHPEEVRYFFLASHYRSPLNYSEENLDHARTALTRLYLALRDLSAAEYRSANPYEERFQAAMDDDFNTPEATAVLFDVVRDINKYRDTAPAQAADAGAALRHFAGMIGLLGSDPEHYLKWGPAGAKAPQPEQAILADEDIERLLEQRAAARNRQDWAESDRIRAYLADRGVILEDSVTGTRWRRV